MRTTMVVVLGAVGLSTGRAWADDANASMPDPDAALIAAGKSMSGNWKCKGSTFAPDGTAVPTTATMKFKLELDKFWIRGDLAIAKSKGEKRAMKTTSFRSYSPADKKWHELSLSNLGGYSIGSSDGPDASGKSTWDVSTQMMGATFPSKSYEEPGAKRGSRHIWGEVSVDGGKTYVKEFDVTCSK
jgi:hypothetical protein